MVVHIENSLMYEQKMLPLEVNYDVPIPGYLSMGGYIHVPTFALARIPVHRQRGIVRYVIRIFANRAPATTEVIQREILRMGHRPADSHTLLALGVSEEDLKRARPIIALDAIWDDPAHGGPYALALTRYHGMRKVDFMWPHYAHNFEWSAGTLFATIQQYPPGLW